jgi:hypothetical protein
MPAASAARELLARLGPLPTVRLGATAGAVEPLVRVEFRLRVLDTLLGGGLPRGRLCEITGPASCGKTALLHSLLATATAHGEVVALVDLPDAFSPPAAAAAGIDLARMLWVRPASLRDALRCAELLVETNGFGMVALDLGAGTLPDTRVGSGAWLRLARAAARSTAAAVVLAGSRVTGSTAALGLALRPLARHWSRRGRGPVLFEGLDTEIALARARLGAPWRRAVAVRVTAV